LAYTWTARETLGHVAEIEETDPSRGQGGGLFSNGNAADEAKRASVIAAMRERLDPQKEKVRCFTPLHGIGALKPMTGDGFLSQKQIDMTLRCDGTQLDLLDSRSVAAA